MLEEQLIQLSCLFIMGVTRLHRGDPHHYGGAVPTDRQEASRMPA